MVFMWEQSEKVLAFLFRGWRVTRCVALAIWEVICWMIIPLVFGFLCYGSITKKIDLSIPQICLAAVALSPWFLRLFARYLSEFNISLKGVSGKLKEGVRNKDEIDKPVYVGNEKHPLVSESEFTRFLAYTKKVLRTLWKYQVELFGPDDIRRWGFKADIRSQDYMAFSIGVGELLKRNLVAVDAHGLVFLTTEGIEFCKKENKEIVRYPELYSYFTAVP